jgi:hypothetical protein
MTAFSFQNILKYWVYETINEHEKTRMEIIPSTSGTDHTKGNKIVCHSIYVAK